MRNFKLITLGSERVKVVLSYPISQKRGFSVPPGGRNAGNAELGLSPTHQAFATAPHLLPERLLPVVAHGPALGRPHSGHKHHVVLPQSCRADTENSRKSQQGN